MAEETGKDLRSATMKALFTQVQEQQRRLAWNDAKLCEFATQTLQPLDPYRKLKVTSVAFLARLRALRLEALLRALRAAHA